MALRRPGSRVDVDVAVKMRLDGEKLLEIARHFRVSRQAVYKAIKDDPRIVAAQITHAGFDLEKFVAQLRSVLPAMKEAA